MSNNNVPQTLLVGLSGPSSSGKTTLARLLRGVFNVTASPEANGTSIKLFILHEDDFYKRDTDIPQRSITSSAHGTRTVQDWDCVESLDLPLLDRTIRYVKQHGKLPDDMVSKEDQNTVGEVDVSNDEVNAYAEEIRTYSKRLASGSPMEVSICILDGFLLFPPPLPLLATEAGGKVEGIEAESVPLMAQLDETLESMLDLKLFLPATRRQTVERRARRTGYVTMEGFWADPPGYVEDLVWPNYARDHGWMFAHREDVDEGRVERDGEWVVRQGIVVGPGSGEVSMREVLGWGVQLLKTELDRILT